jgi:hypothetical protein
MRNPSWFYPFKGIYYFATHRFLWPLLRARLLPLTLLSLFVYALLFTFAFLPQVIFLAIFHGHLAWINATFLTLGEGAAIIAILFEGFFVDETLVDVFDSVLVNEKLENLLGQERVILSAEDGANARQRLGAPTSSAVYSPFSIRQIVEFIVFLPLNFIPGVGVPIFLLLTGYRAGPLQHWRYFKLLGLNKKERKAAIKKRKLKYTWFGTVALMLQLIPGLSMLFLLTTAAGSALWVADLEKTRTSASQAIAQESTISDDPPPAYTDESV